MTDSPEMKVPLSHQLSSGVCSWFTRRIYPRPLWDRTWWFLHHWGSVLLPCCRRGGRASPSLLWGSPASSATVPQGPPSPAGLSRSLRTLPRPATSASALLEAMVDGAFSPSCREVACCCDSSASQQPPMGQPRWGRGAGPAVLCNVSTPQQAVGPRLKGECCKLVERLM